MRYASPPCKTVQPESKQESEAHHTLRIVTVDMNGAYLRYALLIHPISSKMRSREEHQRMLNLVRNRTIEEILRAKRIGNYLCSL